MNTEEKILRHVLSEVLLQDQALADAFFKTTQTLVDTISNKREYAITADYAKSHNDLVKEAKFDWITDYDRNLIRKNPTEHLTPIPSGTVEQRITLVHLNRYAKRPEIIAEMDKLNVRPVLSPEFLALTKAYPDLQRKFPLVGLGSVWVVSDRGRGVLCACGDSGGRTLGLDWDDYGWSGHCRFPAVRKSLDTGRVGTSGRLDASALTPLGEALQTPCPRCDQRWIIHNCPEDVASKAEEPCRHPLGWGVSEFQQHPVKKLYKLTATKLYCLDGCGATKEMP